MLERLAGFVPVVASVGVDEEGQSYNINADTVAGALAGALGARKVIFLTDVEGLFADAAEPETLISACGLADLDGLVSGGSVGTGMLPKLLAVREALTHGVPAAHILDGRLPHVGPHGALHRGRHRHHGHPVIDESLVQREAAALMPNYRRAPVAFVRGEGAYLYDAAGRPYLDCVSAISVNNLGHCHPAVVEAIRRQAGELIITSNLFYTEPMIALAEWIRDHSLGGRVLFGNSGAEACEAALKLARKHGGPGRKDLVSLIDGFHGRTMGALSLTGQPGKQDAFAPLVPGVRFVERDDLAGLEAAVDEPRVRDLRGGRPGGDRRAPGARRLPAPGPGAGRPPRRAAGHGRDPDRPLAHRPALRAPGRRRGARRDVPGQEPRRRGADRGHRGPARRRRHLPPGRPRLDLRRQPARRRGRPGRVPRPGRPGAAGPRARGRRAAAGRARGAGGRRAGRGGARAGA